ncbi:hypothetical protein K432DRAFT_352529 [Lepidopterella palustris CBS 459.81]|uniref:Endoplasmic reticulum lectin n=1 Tax=Lepidopterella palustris CBS 459.81 TaxID=1314670 RepID=A0A8E2JG45_9PEZI|nr:hypothetical protein K432DRAFT_352529 [Lepidopterella palustris CBS 459.81]
MKNFWALPAFLRLVLASPHAFSVFDDLLAFPQYEVNFPDSFVTEDYASSRLAHVATRPTPSPVPDSQETQDLSTAGQQPIGNPNHKGDFDLESPPETYEAVVLDGQRYLCSIPIVATPEYNASSNPEQVKDEEEKELMRATDRGWELLEGMHGNCIYFISGWWSYSFCYKNEVKQFHQLPPSRGVPIYPPVEDTTVKSFVLGRFPGGEGKGKAGKSGSSDDHQGEGEAQKTLDAEPDDGKGSMEVAKLETKGTTRYMVQRLSGGTECDLTGKERKIEVQFHCHPQSADRIGMIKEVATCSYLMVIYTPRLCNDVAFLPPQDNRPHSIDCQPVIADIEVDDWTAAKLKKAEELMALKDTEAPQGSTPNPIIGGIEVGAKREVGYEGKVIEKSVVAGGGKEVYVATVASSEGKPMNEKELRKLADPKDVEKLKRDLQKLAGRKAWKLDLVDTPRGREFRGIIEADDDEVGGGKKQKQKQKEEERIEGKEQGKDKEKQKVRENGEESEEGSEEVYKDEL